MNSILLTKLPFMMHFVRVYSVMSFIEMSVLLNFGLSFSGTLAASCHCATSLPVGEGEQ